MRVPAAVGEYRRAELRSPDPTANPYLAFALLIYAAVYGIENKLLPQKETNINLYKVSEEILSKFEALPQNLKEAQKFAAESEFIKKHMPCSILEAYCSR